MRTVNVFYCRAGRCWVADFTDSWFTQMVFGTTEIPLPLTDTTTADEAARHVEDTHPDYKVYVCYEMG